jgi:hypothetical protein
VAQLAGINNPDDRIIRFTLKRHGNMTAGLGIFGGIDQQVRDDLFEANDVAFDEHPRLR